MLNPNQLKDIVRLLQNPIECKRALAALERDRGELVERLASIDRAIAVLRGDDAPRRGRTPLAAKASGNGAAVVDGVRRKKLRAHIEKVCIRPNCPRKGAPYMAKRINRMYCSGPCAWAHNREKKAKKEADRLRALRANLEKGREALADKRAREAKVEKPTPSRGTTLVPGDSIRSGGATH